MSSRDDRAWIGTRKGLVEMRRGAGGWQLARTHFIADPVTMSLPPGGAGQPLLAALNLGHFGAKLQLSEDEGATWTEVDAPAYPPQPEDAPGPAWKLAQIWALERADGAVWAGTLPGGLFRSADGGRHWALVESLWHMPERLEWVGGGSELPALHSICPHPARPGELLVGISCGGAWRTHDGGQNWHISAKGMRADFMPPEQAEHENSQDPHRIVRCAAAPEVLWCQHHCGIWRSGDGGATWVEVKAPRSSFGFAVAVHPQDPDTAWFVPAVKDEKRIPVDGALVVNRTRDGGRSFETFSAGLPQQDCFDLIYRHALDVSSDGQTLMMGSTTGHLWASHDGGEHWQLVAAHLAPIASVRLG
jgi:hypothetical protein